MSRKNGDILHFVPGRLPLCEVVLSVLASLILPQTQALIFIFVAAIVKALLVARNYTHMKNEKAIIYAMTLVTLAFIFFLGRFPNFVYHLTKC